MVKKLMRLENSFFERLEKTLMSPKLGWRLLRYLSIVLFVGIMIYGASICFEMSESYHNVIENNPRLLEEISRPENVQIIHQEVMKNINSNDIIATIAAVLVFPSMVMGLWSIAFSLECIEKRRLERRCNR